MISISAVSAADETANDVISTDTNDNIIFQDVDSHDLPEHDTANSPYIWIETTGKGTGKYFTKGKMIDITWTKSTEDGITHYYDSNNKEIQLNPGKTWVSIIQNQYADRNVFSATVDGLE